MPSLHEHVDAANWFARMAVGILEREQETGEVLGYGIPDFCLKAVEHAVEAAALTQGVSLHDEYRRHRRFLASKGVSFHRYRMQWVENNVPEIAEEFRLIWNSYGQVSYDLRNGERAKRCVAAMRKILQVLGEKYGLPLRV